MFNGSSELGCKNKCWKAAIKLTSELVTLVCQELGPAKELGWGLANKFQCIKLDNDQWLEKLVPIVTTYSAMLPKEKWQQNLILVFVCTL